MDEELDIIVTGFDVDARQAEAGLTSVFGLDAARARRFLRELPVVAKRSVGSASAERYVHALRSIGARVEVRPAASAGGQRPSSPPAATSSLPAPAPSMMARLGESMRVEQETLSAIRRFRAAEGLEEADADAASIHLDPHNPRIPRAPAVPHDLASMPNAKLPRRRDRPAWMLTDPLAQSEDSAPPPTPSPRPHNDAERPPPPPAVPGARHAATSRSAAPPRAERASGAHSGRPSAAVGLAHSATASIRPGLGMFSWWEFKDAATRRRRLRDTWPVVALLVAAAGAYLWYSGALDSDATRRERALRAEGIEPGEHAPAESWLQAPDNAIAGLDNAAARELVERLLRAGARSVLAVQIQANGSKRAAGLVIELPEPIEQRRTILWLAARARGPQAQVPEEDGRYHLLAFE